MHCIFLSIFLVFLNLSLSCSGIFAWFLGIHIVILFEEVKLNVFHSVLITVRSLIDIAG